MPDDSQMSLDFYLSNVEHFIQHTEKYSSRGDFVHNL